MKALVKKIKLVMWHWWKSEHTKLIWFTESVVVREKIHGKKITKYFDPFWSRNVVGA